jgi:hypothetical protein
MAIDFDKMEKEEWNKPGDDPEMDPLKALQSDPHFFEKHLAGTPNLAAVAALLGTVEKKEE